MLISSAFIVYLGPFDQAFRTELMKKWISMMQLYNIPLIQDFKIQK